MKVGWQTWYKLKIVTIQKYFLTRRRILFLSSRLLRKTRSSNLNADLIIINSGQTARL